jgi:hypothetical protein
VRRDFRGRVVSGLATFGVLIALAWLAASALTQMDTRGAQALRIQLGLERSGAVCGGYEQPQCTYDDAEQRRLDREDRFDRAARTVVLTEVESRVEDQIAQLTQLREMVLSSETEQVIYWADHPAVRAALDPAVDLSPLADRPTELEAITRLRLSARSNSTVFVDAIDLRLSSLHDVLGRAHMIAARKGAVDAITKRRVPASTVLNTSTFAPVFAEYDYLQRWLEQSGPERKLSTASLSLLHSDGKRLAEAVSGSSNIWHNALGALAFVDDSYGPSAVRYASPVEAGPTWRLFGLALFAMAAFSMLVISPTITATETAKEREAGTLPVLRMTGMSADDLAMALVVGPNVFAWVLAASCLVLATPILAFTVGPAALLLPFTLLAIGAAAVHLIAIGLGDALGQRVNALVVGAMVALGVVGPGLIGAALAGLDVANVGLLLGPLPAVAASASAWAQFPGLGLDVSPGELGGIMLAFAFFSQAMLGYLCLRSWRRRVEQPWAPLFRPFEGVLLAFVSICSSALSLVELSQRTNAQDYDSLNLLTVLSCSFLIPLLGWLLVTSIRRPARARAVADRHEARSAFLRFQGFVLTTAAMVGMAYALVLGRSSLAGMDSELMWASLAQGLLLAETAVATFLWVSRRKDGRLRTAFVGGIVLLLQSVAVAGVYALEVEHVARTNGPALPMLLNVEASNYWLGFVLLVWAAGLAVIFAALMRERDKQVAEHEADPEWNGVEGHDGEAEGMPGRRLIH